MDTPSLTSMSASMPSSWATWSTGHQQPGQGIGGMGSGSMIWANADVGSRSSAASATTMIRDRERMVLPLCGVHAYDAGPPPGGSLSWCAEAPGG